MYIRHENVQADLIISFVKTKRELLNDILGVGIAIAGSFIRRKPITWWKR
jgi:hypothetical protein